MDIQKNPEDLKFDDYGKCKDNDNGDCSTTSTNHPPIRRLYVAPIKPHTSDQIKDYFERCGEEESFEVRENFEDGFVQFNDADDANDVLLNTNHSIANCAVKITAVDFWQQPDYEGKPIDPRLVPPEQDSASHILIALNDDCLQEVFKRLTSFDLAIVAEVCIRFNIHAKEVFAAKHTHLDLNDDSKFCYQPTAFNSLFRNFGSSIQSLTIDADIFASDTLTFQTIAQHCTSELKKLRLISFDLLYFMDELKSLFKAVEYLVLQYCQFDDLEVLQSCTELKFIHFDRCSFADNVSIKQTIVKLEEVRFESNSVAVDGDETLESFINLNPQLVKLSIVNDNDKDNYLRSSNVIRLIGQKLSHLHELSFDSSIENLSNFHNDIQQLSRLHSLKVLQLHFNSEPIASLMRALAKNNVPLEHLLISHGSVDVDAIESVSQLKQMKILGLINVKGLTDDHLITLAKDLPQLQEIHLEHSFSAECLLSTIGLKKMIRYANHLSLLKLHSFDNIVIDEDDYKAMLSTVQNRPEKVQLLIQIKSDGGKVEVLETTLAENRSTFYIDEQVIVDNNEIFSWNDSNEFFDTEDDSWADGVDYDYNYSDLDSDDALFTHDGQRFYIG